MKATLRLATFGIALGCAVSSIALADGLSSKAKSRIPSVVDMNKEGKHPPLLLPIDAKKAPGDLKISAAVRKNLRLQALFQKHSQTKIKTVLKKNIDSPINPALRIDRLKLIKRGQGLQPVSCERLHTHDRTTCERDAILNRSDVRTKIVQSVKVASR